MSPNTLNAQDREALIDLVSKAINKTDLNLWIANDEAVNGRISRVRDRGAARRPVLAAEKARLEGLKAALEAL